MLEEWLTNVVRHGYSARTDGAVDFEVGYDERDVVLRFEDRAAAFDPTQTAAPARPASLDDARPGGLGIATMRRHAHRIDYRRVGDRNVLTVSVARD